MYLMDRSLGRDLFLQPSNEVLTSCDGVVTSSVIGSRLKQDDIDSLQLLQLELLSLHFHG